MFERPDSEPVLPAPVRAGEVFAAAVLAKREPPKAEEMKKDRDQFKARLLAQKRREFTQLFLTDLRERADIKMLAKL